EQGTYHEDLSFDNRMLFTSGFNQGSVPSTLFVTDKQVDISGFEFITGPVSQYANYNPYAAAPATPQPTINSVAQVGPFGSLPPSPLFERWTTHHGAGAEL